MSPRKRIHQFYAQKQQNHPGALRGEFAPERRPGGSPAAAHPVLELHGPQAEEHQRPPHHHAQAGVQVRHVAHSCQSALRSLPRGR